MNASCPMDLEQYEKQIAGTTKDDWTIIACWGFGSGPSYLERATFGVSGKGQVTTAEIDSHAVRASLKKDLAIWIAWGFPSNPDFKESWANQFDDPQANSGFVDFFYSGVLVFRDLFVSVDGGRCRLPLPDREFEPKTHKIKRYTVPREKHAFFRMLDDFEQISHFDEYFDRAGFQIVDVPWMV